MEKYSFENYIMQCCKHPEWILRNWLKKQLTQSNFSFIEDDYTTSRVNKDLKYGSIHNLLFIRGSPRICLVAHTDVCRDHLHTFKKPTPTIKNLHGRRIIQDETRQTQVGGDDRLGVAINSWIALNTGYDLALLFTTDEEVGLCSADQVKFKELMDFDLLVQTDRGNNRNQLVNTIGGTRLCSNDTADRLLRIARDIELPRDKVQGFLTDVYAIKGNGKCKEAVNMTVGYHDSYGSSGEEFIDIQEAKDTMKYVASIVKDYDLENIDIKEKVSDIEGALDNSFYERYNGFED